MALTCWPTVCLPLFAFSCLHAQTIEVTPNRVMIDQPASIRAAGLQPNERVAIRAELIDGADAHWTSQAEFVVDSQGGVDTSRQPAVAGSYAGSYKEASSMGLIWSMMPESHKTARYQPPRNFGPQTIEFRLMRGNTQLAAASHPARWRTARHAVFTAGKGSASGSLSSGRIGRRHAGAPRCVAGLAWICSSGAGVFSLRRSAERTRRDSA